VRAPCRRFSNPSERRAGSATRSDLRRLLAYQVRTTRPYVFPVETGSRPLAVLTGAHTAQKSRTQDSGTAARFTSVSDWLTLSLPGCFTLKRQPKKGNNSTHTSARKRRILPVSSAQQTRLGVRRRQAHQTRRRRPTLINALPGACHSDLCHPPARKEAQMLKRLSLYRLLFPTPPAAQPLGLAACLIWLAVWFTRRPVLDSRVPSTRDGSD